MPAQNPGLHPRNSNSLCLGWDCRFCISNEVRVLLIIAGPQKVLVVLLQHLNTDIYLSSESFNCSIRGSSDHQDMMDINIFNICNIIHPHYSSIPPPRFPPPRHTLRCWHRVEVHIFIQLWVSICQPKRHFSNIFHLKMEINQPLFQRLFMSILSSWKQHLYFSHYHIVDTVI